jgi:hypothetical protein
MKYTEQEVSEAMEQLPALWMLKHSVKTSSGLPFEFEDHRFMWDFLNDLSPLQVFLKPPQIGATESEIVKSLWVAKKRRKDIIYTLPTQSDVHDMGGGKVNRIIAQNPVLRSWVQDHDTVEQKAVGPNIIYYRGTFSTKQAMMVSSDLNIHDEVDASDAAVITQYETRLQARKDGWRWYFSHPSIAGFGVDIYWQRSDKKEWFVRCPHCREERVLEWPASVDRASRSYVCMACSGPLSDDDRRGGTWRRTARGEFSGWHASQLMCPWISAGAVLDAFDDPNKDEQYFWNYVLGLPYVGSENKIDAATVLRNVDPRVNGQEPTVVIGVDTGLPVHYVLMNKEGAFFAAKRTPEQRPYEELERLLGRFERSVLVADQGGDLIGIRQLQAKLPNRVFLCHYRKDRRSQQVVKWGEGTELGSVIVDRNRMIQLIVEQLRDRGRVRLNGAPEDWRELAEHFANMYRVAKPTPFGVEYSWERNGPDHYAHALLYAMVGLDRYSEQEARIIGPGALDGLPTARLFQQ